jgi:hypothetical protein
LITFRSEAWSSVMLFDDVALKLLEMMGHSSTVPSALDADDVAGAAARLRRALAAAGTAGPSATDSDEDDEAPKVDIARRAFPLLQLLDAAAAKGKEVMWDRGTAMV